MKKYVDIPNTFALGFAFESSAWGDLDKSVLYYILSWLYGNATGFSVGGPGKGMHSVAHYAMIRTPLVEETKSIFELYVDRGLFGLQFTLSEDQIGEENKLIDYALVNMAK